MLFYDLVPCAARKPQRAACIKGKRRMPIKLGMFLTPASNPSRPMSEVLDWNIDVIRKAEQYGYDEAWIGSHLTSHFSRIACPLQVIARAIGETSRIRLGAGVSVLYQNHPLTMAAQLAQLDHMARGRLNFGFGGGATVSDKIMFGVDGPTSHDMMLEAVEIILQCWSETGPREFDGKYWKVHPPVDRYSGGNYGWHHRPYSPAEPRIAYAGGFGPKSSLLRLAGERGSIPMSLNFFAAHLKGHWESVAEGAAAAGRIADRSRWRMLRDIVVADTDAEARRAALDGFAARFWNEYFKPIAEKLNVTHMFRRPDADPSAELTAEYLIDTKIWAVGSPATVASLIREQFELSEGFGTLLVLGSDYADPGERETWFRSMQLLSTEVMPRLADLTAASSSTSRAS
jgi:alkanesulfonate monooxygenase SsuD/methylene tetrahydromethanopterin reductase-like flavin-dependent oxidoreductase (luciferase family)